MRRVKWLMGRGSDRETKRAGRPRPSFFHDWIADLVLNEPKAREVLLFRAKPMKNPAPRLFLKIQR
jgi:hypothetical protein